MPLLVRGPGVPAGRTLPHLVANIDLAPTLAELAQIAVPPTVDGRSLLPLLRADPPGVESWRADFLIEHYRSNRDGLPSYEALRTQNQVYVRYETSEFEFYDLRDDPFQIDSPRALDPTLRSQLSARLAALAACKGASCR